MRSEKGSGLKLVSVEEAIEEGMLDDIKHLIVDGRKIFAGTGMGMGMRNVGGTMTSVACSNMLVKKEALT